MSQAAVGQRSAHSPQCTHRSSSFTMTRAVCGNAAETMQRLGEILRGRLQARAQVCLVTIARDGQAIDRTDVDTGIALDAQLRAEHRLHVAVEAALHFLRRLLRGETQLHLDVEFLEALLERDVRHEAALGRRVVVRIGPLVHAHLAALQIDPGRQSLGHRLALAVAVNGDRGLVAVLHSPDDVLRAESGITAEKHAGARRLEGALVDDRNVPLVELDAQVALDPREGILLADRQNDIVGRQ